MREWFDVLAPISRSFSQWLVVQLPTLEMTLVSNISWTPAGNGTITAGTPLYFST